MVRILITNAYSARNRGDAAIILGMIESLRRTEVFRKAEFRISSADDAIDAAHYSLPTVPSFQSLKSSVSPNAVIGSLYFLSVLLPLSVLWAVCWRMARLDPPVPGRLRELLREYAASDLVIAAGGGYLYTTSAIRGNVVLLINLYCFFFAALIGKPVALYAQSIGPFAGSWQSWLVRRVLSRVILVEVREEPSHRLLKDWGLATPVGRVNDAAFLLVAKPPDESIELVDRGAGPTVGMTVRKWFRDREQQLEYERSIASFVRWLIQERGASVVFLPQVTFTEGHDDDRIVARKVAVAVGRDDCVLVVENELRAEEIKWLCGRMDFFVGTRMHSNIFALSSGVPTVAIAYQPKTVGIMSELGLGRWVIPIEGLSLDELQRAFDGVAEHRVEISNHLGSAIPDAEAGALEAGGLIAEKFIGWKTQREEPGSAG